MEITFENNTENERKTYVLHGVDNVIDAELEFFANSKKAIDTCMKHTRSSFAFILEPIKKAFLDAKGRGVKLRYLTEITHDNIAASKELMTIVDELRHSDGIRLWVYEGGKKYCRRCEKNIVEQSLRLYY
jgi:hypothetical protein